MRRGRNSLYAFIGVLHPTLVSNEAISIAAVLAGYDNINVLQAAASFLHENHASVVALFAHDPHMADWLAMQRMRNGLPE